MFNFADLVASLSLDAGDFISGAGAATAAWADTESAVEKSAGNMQTHVQSIGEYFGNIADTFKNNVPAIAGVLGDMIDKIGENSVNLIAGGATLTASLTAPIVALGEAAFSTASQFNAAQLAFSTMMHSGEQAKEFLNDLKAFAAATPFEFTDLTRAAQRMMTFGFAAKDVIPMMTALGDASGLMNTGTAGIERMTVALGQMQMKTKVSAQEMQQLGEAGISAWQYLADAAGKSVAQVQKEAEQGAIRASDAIPVILAGIEKTFGGGMEKFSQTVEGRFSTLKDNLTQALGNLGQLLLPIASDIIEKFAMPAVDFIGKLVDGFLKLPAPVQDLALAAAALVAAIGPIVTAVGLLTTGIMALAPLLGTSGLTATLGALAGILGPVALAIGAVWAAWELWKLDSVKSAVGDVMGAISDFWTNTLSLFLDVVVNLGTAFATAAGQIIGAGLEAAWSTLKDIGSGLMEVLDALWNNVLVPLGDAFVAVYNAVSPLLGVLGSVLGFIGELALDAVIVSWNIFKEAVSAVWAITSTLASLLKDMLIGAFQLLGGLIKDVGGWLSTLLKPAVDAVVGAFTTLVGWLQQIPGVATAMKAIGQPFDDLKAKISDTLTDATNKASTLSTTGTAANTTLAASYKDVKSGADGAKDGIDGAKAAAEAAKEKKSALSDANKELTSSETTLANLLKTTSVPIHKDLVTATNNLESARTKEKDAATNLQTAEKNLRDKMADGKTSTADLKDATNDLKFAKEQATLAANAFKDAENALKDAKQADKDQTKALDDVTKLYNGTLLDVLTNLPQVGLNVTDVRDDVVSMSGVMKTAQTDAYDTQNALKSMGITPKEDLKTLADTAADKFKAIRDSGVASASEIEQAHKNALQKQVDYYNQAGIDVPKALQTELDALEAKYNTHKNNVSGPNGCFDQMTKNINSSISQLSTDLVKNLFEGKGSFGDKALSTLTTIGEQVTTAFITPATTAITGFIDGALKKLMDNLFGDNGLLGGLGKIGDKITNIFNVPSGSTPSVPTGTNPAGGGNPAGGAAGAVGSSVTGVLTSVFTGISAVTDVLGMFGVGVQGSINDHLKDIRNDTWYIAWALGEGGMHDALLEQKNNFKAWMDGAFGGWFRSWLTDVGDATEGTHDMTKTMTDLAIVNSDVYNKIAFSTAQSAQIGQSILAAIESFQCPNNVTIVVQGNLVGDDANAQALGETVAKAQNLQGVGY